jgi:hypothetical protein
MREVSLLTVVLGLTLLTGACSNPDYKPDPDVEACNAGGPLTARQRMYAMAPKPQAVSGMPIDCQRGHDGVMRLLPPATH